MLIQNSLNKQNLSNHFIYKSKIFYTSIILFIMFFASVSVAGENVLQLFEKEFKKVVNSSRPAVVKVLATYDSAHEFKNNIGKVTMFRQDISSGIILDNKGHIVTTSFNLIPLKVEIVYNNRKLPAKLIGMDDLTDLAVLKTEHKLKKQMREGDSSDIESGSLVFTIGSSQGNHPIFSFGVVSGIEDLPAHPCAGLIKINAPVSVGNSGGAVVNTSGEVIGMILAVLTPQNHFSALPTQFPMQLMNSQIITFAVPIDTVKSVASQIIKHGKVPRGWLGVDIVTQDVGVLVTRVLEDSPAARSGLLPEDIIIKFNKKPVKTYIELLRCVGNSTPNTDVILNIIRDGNKKNYTIKLGERKLGEH